MHFRLVYRSLYGFNYTGIVFYCKSALIAAKRAAMSGHIKIYIQKQFSGNISEFVGGVHIMRSGLIPWVKLLSRIKIKI